VVKRCLCLGALLVAVNPVSSSKYAFEPKIVDDSHVYEIFYYERP
jgi:hypothetical protein